jgi:hypothetical protein
MKIQDLAGNEYELTKDKLSHLEDEDVIAFFIRLAELRAKPYLLMNDDLLAHGEVDHAAVWVQLRTVNDGGEEDSGWVKVPVENNRIGCRKFSPATFAKILKAAGVKTRKPAKKGKK